MVDFSKDNSFETQQTDKPGAAATIGAGLREVRERLGWKLVDIAEHIRIRAVFLNAIEAGDLTSLPGTAYRVGFVRSYAQALGLDGEEILQRFRDAGQIGELEKNEIKLLAPVPDRGVPTGVIIFIAFIVAIGGYGLWYHHTQQMRKMAQNVLQIPAKLQPLTAPPKVTPVAAPAPAASHPAATEPASTQAAPTTPAATPSQPDSVSTPPAQSDTSALASTTSTPPQTSATTAANADQGMVITATQPSWIQVTAPDGTILFSRVLNAGESWPVPHMAGLKMTTGNAGGTIISSDGKAGQPLGAMGVVIHNYQLTPPTQGSAAQAASSPAPAAAQ